MFYIRYSFNLVIFLNDFWLNLGLRKARFRHFGPEVPRYNESNSVAYQNDTYTEPIRRFMYRASYCNVYINQRDAQILVNNLYFFIKWLYMFRAIISPSSGTTFNKLYSATGTCRYVWLSNAS